MPRPFITITFEDGREWSADPDPAVQAEIAARNKIVADQYERDAVNSNPFYALYRFFVQRPETGARRAKTRFAWTPRALMGCTRVIWLIHYHQTSEYNGYRWVVTGESFYKE